jgi:hypothetical protein
LTLEVDSARAIIARAGCQRNNGFDTRGERAGRRMRDGAVRRHLAAKRPDWLDHTVELYGEERENLLRDVRAILDGG